MEVLQLVVTELSYAGLWVTLGALLYANWPKKDKKFSR